MKCLGIKYVKDGRWNALNTRPKTQIRNVEIIILDKEADPLPLPYKQNRLYSIS